MFTISKSIYIIFLSMSLIFLLIDSIGDIPLAFAVL